jgi:hypothetical protein
MLMIGEDDERYKIFQRTSEELAKKLSKKKGEIGRYTLVALDSSISPNEPLFSEVETILKRQWPTYRNTYPNPPVPFLRATILEALRIASNDDVTIAAIVWLTGSSFLPYTIPSTETDILTALLTYMGEKAEEEAGKKWGVNHEHESVVTKIPSLSLTLPQEADATVEVPEIDKEFLTERLIAAAGPNDVQGNAIASPRNSYWPNQNAPWGQLFAEIASAGIAEAVESSLQVLSEEIAGQPGRLVQQINIQLTAYSTELNKWIKAALLQASNGATTGERRTRLLWWKESLYSHSLQKSYRDMPSATTTFAMAYDLYRQVPAFCPRSVDFFLRETIQGIGLCNGKATQSTIPLGDFITLLRTLTTDRAFSDLHKRVGSTSDSTGLGRRQTLLECVLSEPSKDGDQSVEITTRLGVASDTEIEFGDLAVWLFHDLQSMKLAQVASK